MDLRIKSIFSRKSGLCLIRKIVVTREIEIRSVGLCPIKYDKTRFVINNVQNERFCECAAASCASQQK